MAPRTSGYDRRRLVVVLVGEVEDRGDDADLYLWYLSKLEFDVHICRLLARHCLGLIHLAAFVICSGRTSVLTPTLNPSKSTQLLLHLEKIKRFLMG
jgi:hypothetical protein